MLGAQLDTGCDLKAAIKNLIELKLLGTWRLAVMLVDDPSQIYVIKNVGPMFIAKSRQSVVVSSDKEAIEDLTRDFRVKKMVNNTLYEINADCSIVEYEVRKKIQVERKPRPGYDHLFQEEIHGSIEAASAVTDDGGKFLSNHQVVLGGFERAEQELVLINNLMIAVNGSAKWAAQYGAWLMKHLQIFNTVRIFDGDAISKRELQQVKNSGLLTLSQSGDGKNLIRGIIEASKLGVTCINVVNVEDSPITRIIQEIKEELLPARDCLTPLLRSNH